MFYKYGFWPFPDPPINQNMDKYLLLFFCFFNPSLNKINCSIFRTLVKPTNNVIYIKFIFWSCIVSKLYFHEAEKWDLIYNFVLFYFKALASCNSLELLRCEIRIAYKLIKQHVSQPNVNLQLKVKSCLEIWGAIQQISVQSVELPTRLTPKYLTDYDIRHAHLSSSNFNPMIKLLN